MPTKHYYIEGERICTKIGGGFGLVAPLPPLDTAGTNTELRSKTQFQCTTLLKLFLNCFGIIPNKHSFSDISSMNATWYNTPNFAAQLWTMVKRGFECAGNKVNDISILPGFSAINNSNNLENYRYYYHPDHIGSSSFITNQSGNVIEHLQYMPYGENFISQRSGRYDTPYKFSGKEKDNETSYSYFGARYYDSDLSIWLSVDRLVDQNLGISPYNYCHNNPVMIIDPDGMNDGWVQTSDGIYWDKNINSQDDFNKSGLSGKYLGQTGFGKDANSDSRIFYSDSGEKQVLLSEVEINEYSVSPIESNSGSNTVDIFSHPSDNLKDDPLQYGIKELLATTEDFLFGWAKQTGQDLRVATDNTYSTKDRVNAGVNAAILIGFGLPGKNNKNFTKLKGNQGWRDPFGNFWKKDMKHKDHYDISEPKNNKKIGEVDFNGNQIWPEGAKNKNKK